ncbi:MAG: hypothetical protein E7399_05845 [Ruminococcaceae bacterium]|nr:hypothetical protein [Oscillospiraceae bacterium]
MSYNHILVNQVGFHCHSTKRFVITKTPETMEFTIVKTEHCKEIVKYTGMLKEEISQTGNGYVGDFSELTEEGDYFIKCGTFKSRFFVIYQGAYYHPIRVMLSYFTYQRCGNELGWAGKCHCEDSLTTETGERIDLSGGYHQSCDLRKSPGGVSIGLYAMMRAALNDSTDYGQVLFKAEIEHACDYLIRLFSEEGFMRNTLSFPFGWGAREFYDSPAPSSGQWCATRFLALASLIIPENKEIYMRTALRSWEYLTSDRRSDEKYEHPAETPLGMDQASFFALAYKGSTEDRAYQICCAADFYRATKDEAWLTYVKEAIHLDPYELTGNSLFSYSISTGIFFALSDAAELCGICKEQLREAAESLILHMDDDLWRRPVMRRDRKMFDIQMVNHARQQYTIADISQDFIPIDDRYLYKFYSDKGISTNVTFSSLTGAFLEIAGNLLGETKYRKYAQYIADYLLGVNPMDASHIESIGYNQIPRAAFGQFFPSTPQIPGGVTVGFGVDSTHAEYDMPCVGSVMWLLSEIAKQR